MPRIVNGVIQPSGKTKAYERIDGNDRNDVENPLRKCCKCNCNGSRTKCCAFCNDRCVCSFGSCTFVPSMLLSIEAFIGYSVFICSALLFYFVSWQVGVIVFVISCIAYAFLLNYRCWGPNGAEVRNQYETNLTNPNRRSGIMGVGDLPKTKKGG
eukprot:571966_1